MYDQNWLEKFDFSVPPPNMTSKTSCPPTPVQLVPASRGQEMNKGTILQIIFADYLSSYCIVMRTVLWPFMN